MAKKNKFDENMEILRETFENSDDNVKASGTLLLEHLDFMHDMLCDLKSEIKKSGLIITITNGKDVFPKENPAVTSFNKNHKEYISTLKQIINLLPNDSNLTIDSFDEFEG